MRHINACSFGIPCSTTSMGVMFKCPYTFGRVLSLSLSHTIASCFLISSPPTFLFLPRSLEFSTHPQPHTHTHRQIFSLLLPPLSPILPFFSQEKIFTTLLQLPLSLLLPTHCFVPFLPLLHLPIFVFSYLLLLHSLFPRCLISIQWQCHLIRLQPPPPPSHSSLTLYPSNLTLLVVATSVWHLPSAHTEYSALCI